MLLNYLGQLATQCTGTLYLIFTNNGAKQAHEKVFDITNHGGNTDQNYNKLYFTSVRLAIVKKKTMTNVGEDVEKTVGENVNWYSHYGKQYGGCKKIKNRTTI